MEPKPAQINTNPHNKKVLVIGLILVIASTALALGWYYYGLNQPKQIKVLTKPKIIKQKGAVQELLQGHPKVFSLNLEYDPKTDQVLTKSAKVINANPTILFSNPPMPAADKFIYRVSLVSDSGEVLAIGWAEELKAAIETSQGSFKFFVSVLDTPGATLQVSLPNDKPLWIGKVK